MNTEVEHSFSDFIDVYYTECMNRFSKIEAVAAKWKYEDLIHGLSDCDIRFICSNDMNAEDWCRMSSAIGDVHLELCRRFPYWSRMMEHLPGINLTWNELADDYYYYPEYRQWTFYKSRNHNMLEKTNRYLDNRAWEIRDEYFQLKRFVNFFGQYDRNIDPAINVGEYEFKYPLHSRFMHYFIPAIQSAVSIMLKRNIKGKLESLQLTGQLFPKMEIIHEIQHAIQCHYDIPELYNPTLLPALDNKMFDALQIISNELGKHVTVIPDPWRFEPLKWKKSLLEYAVAPQMVIFDHVKFSRLFKGRLHFYVHAPAHFASTWLIRNELKRCRDMFYRVPYTKYWEVLSGEKSEDVAAILSALHGTLLTKEEVEAALQFSQHTASNCQAGNEKAVAEKIEVIFDLVYTGLHRMSEHLRFIVHRKAGVE